MDKGPSVTSINPFIHHPFPLPLPSGVSSASESGFYRVEANLPAFRLLAKLAATANKETIDMKKIILIAGAAVALVLAGCDKGGTSDQYGTSSGTANSNSNSANGMHSSSNSPVTP